MVNGAATIAVVWTPVSTWTLSAWSSTARATRSATSTAPIDEGDGNTLEVRLYHMLMDLRRMATLHGIKFDETVAQTAADYEDIYGDEAA